MDLDWLPPHDRVIVSCTARRNGVGPRPLPPRRDGEGDLGAVMVEDPDDAAAVFAALDRPGRVLYVDVERKQPADLMAIALATVRDAEVRHAKPNDATVRSADVVLTHHLGPQLAGTTIAVVGFGNLGFKIALLLAERNARVLVRDVRADAVERGVAAINGLLPRYQEAPVAEWDGQPVDALLTCSAVPGVVTAEDLTPVRDGAFVLDVGINNLTPEAVAEALARHMTLVRLDTRASGEPVPSAAPAFFEELFGIAEIDGVPVASGGAVGPRGTVVVDAVGSPTVVVGIANGAGGIVPPGDLSEAEREAVARVEAHVRESQAGA